MLFHDSVRKPQQVLFSGSSSVNELRRGRRLPAAAVGSLSYGEKFCLLCASYILCIALLFYLRQQYRHSVTISKEQMNFQAVALHLLCVSA